MAEYIQIGCLDADALRDYSLNSFDNFVELLSGDQSNVISWGNEEIPYDDIFGEEYNDDYIIAGSHDKEFVAKMDAKRKRIGSYWSSEIRWAPVEESSEPELIPEKIVVSEEVYNEICEILGESLLDGSRLKLAVDNTWKHINELQICLALMTRADGSLYSPYLTAISDAVNTIAYIRSNLGFSERNPDK